MTIPQEIIVAFLAIASGFVLYYKGIVRKDLGVLGSLLPRIYLIGTILYDVIVRSVDATYMHIGIILVLFGDLISNLFIVLSRRFKVELYAANLVDVLTNLKVKYDFIVDHIPVGIYVINKAGRFEFVNNAMTTITGYTEEELLTMDVYQIIPLNKVQLIRDKIVQRITDIKPEETYTINLKRKDDSQINVSVSARHTINGHDTITGAIYVLGE